MRCRTRYRPARDVSRRARYKSRISARKRRRICARVNARKHRRLEVFARHVSHIVRTRVYYTYNAAYIARAARSSKRRARARRADVSEHCTVLFADCAADGSRRRRSVEHGVCVRHTDIGKIFVVKADRAADVSVVCIYGMRARKRYVYVAELSVIDTESRSVNRRVDRRARRRYGNVHHVGSVDGEETACSRNAVVFRHGDITRYGNNVARRTYKHFSVKAHRPLSRIAAVKSKRRVCRKHRFVSACVYALALSSHEIHETLIFSIVDIHVVIDKNFEYGNEGIASRVFSVERRRVYRTRQRRNASVRAVRRENSRLVVVIICCSKRQRFECRRKLRFIESERFQIAVHRDRTVCKEFRLSVRAEVFYREQNAVEISGSSVTVHRKHVDRIRCPRHDVIGYVFGIERGYSAQSAVSYRSFRNRARYQTFVTVESGDIHAVRRVCYILKSRLGCGNACERISVAKIGKTYYAADKRIARRRQAAAVARSLHVGKTCAVLQTYNSAQRHKRTAAVRSGYGAGQSDPRAVCDAAVYTDRTADETHSAARQIEIAAQADRHSRKRAEVDAHGAAERERAAHIGG